MLKKDFGRIGPFDELATFARSLEWETLWH